MTTFNNEIIYKITVTGVNSYVNKLPVSSITTNFVAGEIIQGTSSTATAVVDRDTMLSDAFIYVRTISGVFITQEDLTGTVAGVAVKDGSLVTEAENYDAAEFDIVDGTWTIDTTGDLLTDINNAQQQINISEGGNFASGYTFGFEVTNFDFVKQILDNGVFFKYLDMKLEIDLGSGFTQEWTGIVDTFRSQEAVMTFSCIDAGKKQLEKVGSDVVPITFNKNYNCKLPLDEENSEKYRFNRINKTSGIRGATPVDVFAGFLNQFDEGTDSLNFLIDDSKSDFFANFESNFNDGYIQVLTGLGAGLVFKIYNVTRVVQTINLHKYTFYVNEQVSGLKGTIGGAFEDVSVCSITSFDNIYNLSKQPVFILHDQPNSNIQSSFTITQDEVKHFLSTPENYIETSSAEVGTQVKVTSLSSSGDITIFSSVSIPFTNLDVTTLGFAGDNDSGNIEFKAQFVDLRNLDILSEKLDDLYIDVGKITFKDLIVSAPIDSLFIDLWFEGFYRDLKHGPDDRVNVVKNPLEKDQGHYSISQVGNDFVIEFNTTRFLNLFKINNYSDGAELSSIQLSMTISVSGGVLDNGWDTDTEFEGLNILYGGDFSLDELSVGCSGENVTSGEFDNPPNTIQYLIEEYISPTATFNAASFTQANDDYDLFVSDINRNLAHQIVEENDSNAILKELLYYSHLGLFIGRDGSYYLNNWLPKSIVFSSTGTIAEFDETTFIDIGKISRDNLNNITSDFELKFNYSEFQGEFLDSMRIKNTDGTTFDFADGAEGVENTDEAVAEQAWNLLSSGFKRIRKQSQTNKESKWIKTVFNNNFGKSEAISFIRNQAAHSSREHEYVPVTVPYNTANLALELLSFIQVKDDKITDGDPRKGWIVKRVLDTKKHRIIFTVLLDINPFDPFIRRLNIWQDTSTSIIEYQDDETSLEFVQNGTGI